MLKKCPESDWRHQEQLGAHVFATALLGLVSSFVSLSYAFGEQSGIIFVFALLWGLSIFLFDRTLIISPILSVSSKATNDASSNLGEPKIAWWMLFIRLLMAILLALFIATPFELKIFQPEIEVLIIEQNLAEQTQELNKEIADWLGKKGLTIRQYDEASKAQKSEEQTSLDTQIKAAQDQVNKLISAREGELNGTSGSKIKGYGDYTLHLNSEIKEQEDKISNFQQRLSEIAKNQDIVSRAEKKKFLITLDEYQREVDVRKERLNYLATVHTEKEKSIEKEKIDLDSNTAISDPSIDMAEILRTKSIKTDALNGIDLKDASKSSLLERIKALNALKDKPEVSWSFWVIWAVFVLFETLPISAKYFFKNSPYDLEVLQEKVHVKIEYQKRAIINKEELTRLVGTEYTKSRTQDKANEEILKDETGSKMVRAYVTKLSQTIDRFLANNSLDPSNDEEIKQGFEAYFQDFVNFSKHQTEQPNLPLQPQAAKPFHAMKFMYLTVFCIALSVIQISIVLYVLDTSGSYDIPVQAWATILGAIIASGIGFAALFINSKKLEHDTKPSSK
ncbi:hypothetical protein JCM14076_12980 [Methylosoma difficile]